MNKEVLVLNKSWLAIDVADIKKAINLLFSFYQNGQPKAVVVDTETYSEYTWEDWSKLKPIDDSKIIRTYSQEFRLPRIIRLTRYSNMPKRTLAFNRRYLYERDSYTCQYCGKKPGSSELTIDHVIPKSHGGKTTWENCVVACVSCNVKKSNILLENTNMTLLNKPAKPKCNFLKGKKTIAKDWQDFISEMYWEVELK